jgi:ADP-ribose pyrophosphatase YjhB (NUDIX family)
VNLREAIARLNEAAGDPGTDLPEELFQFISRVTPLVNVDLLIKDEQQRTLLTWRDDDFYGSGWHVPGGIIRYKEHAVDRIRKVANQEIGSFVDFDPAPIAIIEAMSEQRERGHFISMLYRCRLLGQPDPKRRAGTSPRRGEWKWHSGTPRDLLAVHKHYEEFF